MSARWDDKHNCSRCNAMAHDIIDEGRHSTSLECCFCGQVDRVPPIRREKLDAPAPEFRFPHGRFAGKTLAEVDADPNGRVYLEFQRANSPALRSVIDAHFFSGT